MLLYFLINKRDRVRHKILMYLYFKQETLPDKDIDKAFANHWRIAKDINEPRQYVVDYHELLIDNKHVTCDNVSNRDLHEICLTLDGRTAALEKTYYRAGLKEFYNLFYITTGWLIPLAAFLLSITTLLRDNDTTASLVRQQKQIEQQQIQLQQAEIRIKTLEAKSDLIPDSLYRQSAY